jgi:hypothetical protein
MEPIRAFHGTLSSFERFLLPARGIGIHFGTKPQALQRVRARVAEYGSRFKSPIAPRIIEVNLDLRHPLRMPDIGGWHCPIDTWQAIDEHYPGLLAATARLSTRAQLIAAGYDGIVYVNGWEIPPDHDVRQDSYAVFDPAQITVIGESVVDLEELSVLG